MKRLQILIEEELDAALDKKAREERRSKAALIRQYVGERLKPLPPLATDPLRRIVGADAFEPKRIDDVVYR
jgi:hypothetical protein